MTGKTRVALARFQTLFKVLNFRPKDQLNIIEARHRLIIFRSFIHKKLKRIDRRVDNARTSSPKNYFNFQPMRLKLRPYIYLNFIKTF